MDETPLIRRAIGGPGASRSLSSGEAEQRYNEVVGWLARIGDAGDWLGGARLDTARGAVVGAAAGAPEPALVVSGFVVIRAASYEDAVRHAERSPIVARGGQVLVKELR